MTTMRKVITNRLLETVKPTAKRQDIRDMSFPGFSVRVTSNGRKTFYLAYRWGLEQRHPALGVYPIVSLAKAREKAVQILRLVDDGVDPQARRRRAVTDACWISGSPRFAGATLHSGLPRTI
jgi:hypothetical protein